LNQPRQALGQEPQGLETDKSFPKLAYLALILDLSPVDVFEYFRMLLKELPDSFSFKGQSGWASFGKKIPPSCRRVKSQTAHVEKEPL
jgi:hypothetical protein